MNLFPCNHGTGSCAFGGGKFLPCKRSNKDSRLVVLQVSGKDTYFEVKISAETPKNSNLAYLVINPTPTPHSQVFKSQLT